MQKFKTFKSSLTVTPTIKIRRPTSHEIAHFGNIAVGSVVDIPFWKGPWVNLSGSYHRKSHPDLTPEHPDYLFAESQETLSVNWVDAADPSYFDYQGKGVEVMHRILAFLTRQTKPVLIVCDQGVSRAPSVALLYLAKTNKITASSFMSAKDEFTHSFYPQYAPGPGIATFITNNWTAILSEGAPHETDNPETQQSA